MLLDIAVSLAKLPLHSGTEILHESIFRTLVLRSGDCSSGVRRGMDKSLAVFKSHFYTFTPFFIVNELLSRPVEILDYSPGELSRRFFKHTKGEYCIYIVRRKVDPLRLYSCTLHEIVNGCHINRSACYIQTFARSRIFWPIDFMNLKSQIPIANHSG